MDQGTSERMSKVVQQMPRHVSGVPDVFAPTVTGEEARSIRRFRDEGAEI